MTQASHYHIHDRGPGPWLARITGWDFRYTVCTGPACHGTGLDCHVIGVAESLRRVNHTVRKHVIETKAGRTKPFYEYPAREVSP